MKPFFGKTKGQTKAETLSRAVEHEEDKATAANLTQVPDEDLPQLRATPPAGR